MFYQQVSIDSLKVIVSNNLDIDEAVFISWMLPYYDEQRKIFDEQRKI